MNLAFYSSSVKIKKLAKQICIPSQCRTCQVCNKRYIHIFQYVYNLSFYVLSIGWNITDIGCGNTSIIISADDTLIAWGASPTYGELGIGEFQKSSTVPKEVPKMDNMKIPQVTMGYSHTVLLVNTEQEATKLKYEKMPEYTIDD